MISVAIVDDDPIVCSSIGTILTATGTAQVLWSAHDGEAAVANCRRHAPDVLLIDVQMPGIDGLEAAERILQDDPDARILILTTFADPDYIRRAIDLHTKGYLIKQDVASVVPAVQAVMAVCLAALAALVETKTWLTLSMAFCVAAVAIPTWAMFLPLVACDLAYQLVFCATPRTRHAKYVLTAAPCAAACVVTGMALMSIGGVWPHDARALACMLLMPLTVLAAVAGWLRADGLRSQMRYRALADARRERLRLSHARIADVEAQRTADMRQARLNERTRIAREIHDNVGHVLTRAIMMTQADHVVAATVGDAEHAAQFGQISATLDEAMTLIRASVHDLKDEGTDFHSMVEDAASVDEGVPLTVHLADGIEHAPAAVARCFAAVIREALTNAVRHGTASEATVKLIDLPGLWQLIVQDNGGKPISAGAMRSAGIGLADIEERARALGGNATCGPYGEGWRVFVSIPKPDPAQQTTQGA